MTYIQYKGHINVTQEQKTTELFFVLHWVTHMLGKLDVNIHVRILKSKLSAG